MAFNSAWGPANPTAGPQNTNNYQPWQVDENGVFGPSVYQSITAAPPFSKHSFEELRLNDYSQSRGVVVHPSANITAFTHALAPAIIRQRLNAFSKPPFSRRIPASCGRRLGSEVILFKVGKEGDYQEFTIHENVISPLSEFVRLALTKDWKEAQQRAIPLPDDEAEVFELLQEWLYTRNIPSLHLNNGAKDSAEYKQLVHAYILGDKFGIIDFKDAIIDSIILKLRFTGRFDPRLANFVYDNTVEQSPLRRLWQDIYVFAGNMSWLDEGRLGEFIHAEFTLHLSQYYMRMKEGQGPLNPPYEDHNLGGCIYHDHGRSPCYRSKLT